MGKSGKLSVLVSGALPPLLGGMATYCSDYLNTRLTSEFDITICRAVLIKSIFTTRGLFRLGLRIINCSMIVPVWIITLLAKRPDIVHIHTNSYAGFYVKCILALLAKMVGAKTILHVHGAEFKEFYANMSGIACYLTRRLINANSAVIALSAEWREFFVSIGVIREKIVVMLNSIFLPDIAETKTVPEKLTVLFLSRLEKRKGIHELVTAIEEQSDLSKKYRFVLAGPKANEWHAVQKRIGRLPLSNTVEMPGLLVGKDKDIAYRQADIYVLQSYAEGLPIGLLEAMSYGLACITTPVGGIPDLIINGKNGLLVRPGSAEDLANALARLAQEPELRAKLGKEARSTVEKEYDWTIRAEQITELYYNLKQLGKTNC